MPIGIYAGFLGRCLLSSREYAALKNSVIERAPGSSSIVEILCHSTEATLLLDRARRFYPVAVPFIEEALEDLVTLTQRPNIERLYPAILGTSARIARNGLQPIMSRLRTFRRMPRPVMNAWSRAGMENVNKRRDCQREFLDEFYKILQNRAAISPAERNQQQTHGRQNCERGSEEKRRRWAVPVPQKSRDNARRECRHAQGGIENSIGGAAKALGC